MDPEAVLRESLLDESRALKAQVGRFATRAAWLAGPDGEASRARLERHLSRVLRFDPEGGAAPAAPRSWLHLVHWNILHGDRYPAVAHALRHEPELVGADLVSLNECDFGMARSGNRHVAFDLARELGLHAVWTPLFLELEAGFRAPPEAAQQEQRESLFGLALLSRWPLGRVERVPLPSPADLLFDRERHVGEFVGLVAEVLRPGGLFHAVVTHLDVHSSPRLRRQQMQALLGAVPSGPAVLAGDLNTTTFARGGALRAARTILTLRFTRRRRLRRRLLSPHLPPGRAREPLFDTLRAHGFRVDRFHDGRESLDMRFDDVHELDALPAALRQPALRLLRPVEKRCGLRLDWIAARGFQPAHQRAPFVLRHLMRGDEPASDHAPIGVGLREA